MYKKRHQEKLSFRDKWTLMVMSMRGWIWRHEGDAFVQNLKNSGNTLLWMLVWYFIIGFALGIFGAVITAALQIVASFFVKEVTLFAALKGLVMTVFYFFVIELLIFDPKKVKRSLSYGRSAWWNNTGIHPVEVVADPGTYGEYAATMRIEEEIEKSGKFGKIYNSVLIPIKNHGVDTYAESDIIAVTEKSIQLFEVKNHTGRITGTFSYEADTWFRNEEYDPDKKYGNPLRQNQHHINYLIEYIYPVLKEKGLLNANNPLYGCFLNAVMYTDNRYGSVEVDVSGMPVQTGLFLSSGSKEDGGYTVEVADALAAFEPGKAAAQEICSILDGLTDMDPMRHRALVGNKVMTDLEMSGTAGYAVRYAAVGGVICGHENIGAVERSNGEHVWYDLRGDHMFWAVPEFTVTARAEQQSGEEGYRAALAKVRK